MGPGAGFRDHQKSIEGFIWRGRSLQSGGDGGEEGRHHECNKGLSQEDHHDDVWHGDHLEDGIEYENDVLSPGLQGKVSVVHHGESNQEAGGQEQGDSSVSGLGFLGGQRERQMS